MIRIVLIEDDLALAEITKQYLENFGFAVRHAINGDLGLKMIEQELPDIILLDLMLPGIDGLEISRRLRSQSTTAWIPILMLTARGNETDRVVGLEIGADDYVTKPYSLRELVARIKAILRRTSQEKDFLLPNKATLAVRSQIIRRGALELDYTSRTCCYHGDFLSLTATEFEMLWLFVSRPGQVLTREQLLDSVRGREFEIFDRSIDVHVSKLRKKLEDDPKHPQLIHTVWGVGYRFVSPE